MDRIASLLGMIVSLSAVIAIPVGMTFLRRRRRRVATRRELKEQIETFR